MNVEPVAGAKKPNEGGDITPSLPGELNRASDSLGLYRAELARILCLKCAEVSDAKMFRILLNGDREVRHRAERFVDFYRLLERTFAQTGARSLSARSRLVVCPCVGL